MCLSCPSGCALGGPVSPGTQVSFWGPGKPVALGREIQKWEMGVYQLQSQKVGAKKELRVQEVCGGNISPTPLHWQTPRGGSRKGWRSSDCDTAQLHQQMWSVVGASLGKKGLSWPLTRAHCSGRQPWDHHGAIVPDWHFKLGQCSRGLWTCLNTDQSHICLFLGPHGFASNTSRAGASTVEFRLMQLASAGPLMLLPVWNIQKGQPCLPCKQPFTAEEPATPWGQAYPNLN